MDNFLIEPIAGSEINEVSTLLTNAFYNNAAYTAVFKNKKHLKEGLQWLFKASLLINNQKQPLTMVIKDGASKEIVGTYTLIPPEGIESSSLIYTKIGIGSFIFKFGIGSLVRMLKLDSINKSVLDKSLENIAHNYLSMVAIKEVHRGKGIGSVAIKHAINSLLESDSDCRIIGLTTQLPENVLFYSKLGFEKLDEGYITFRESKYYNYNMCLRDLSR